jgi:hypothetical protein
MKLDERQILNIVAEELQQSAGGNENDFVDANRQRALATYLGQPDGKEIEGRSTIVSTDVADAIEWILPEIVKAFTQNNDVVAFDPVFSGDEDQAELESAYVYDILMKDNNGFLIIHQFVKDALMQKNGFIKTFYEKKETVTTEHFTGLTEVDFNMILSDPEIELMEQTIEEEEQGILVYDIKVKRTISDSKIVVMTVPPEEFRVNKMHNSVDLSSARFKAHVLLKTTSDLVERGFNKEFIDSIPTAQVYEDDREYRFYMQDETVYPDRDVNSDASLRHIEISECYMHMDIDDDGIAELVKIEVSGGDNPDVILGIEEIDGNPFISSTAILMSHKLFGLSIYDRLKQIQDQKTTLWRNIFDNMYLQNNQRTIVVENQVNLDDLMVSRPGGIIRAKRIDAVAPYPTPPLPADAYKMMDYLDQVRASRSGVTPEGPIQDTMIGDRVGSEGVEKMMNQREELVGLMVRVIAETGIKPLCYKIREQVIKHQDVAKEYKFKGKWVEVNPKNWRKRTNTTVRVGTGSGNRKEQAAAVTNIMSIQEKIMANPSQALITERQVFAAVDDYAKSAGLPGAGRYLLDPKSPEGQENKKQVDQKNEQMQKMEQEKEQALAEAQIKIANAEELKAKATGQNVMLKNQVDTQKNEIILMEKENSAQMAVLEQQLEEAKAVGEANTDHAELQYKYWEAKERYEVERERIAATERQAKANNANREKSDG